MWLGYTVLFGVYNSLLLSLSIIISVNGYPSIL